MSKKEFFALVGKKEFFALVGKKGFFCSYGQQGIFDRKYAKGNKFMNNIKVKLKKLGENAIVPSYGTEYAAGADLYALTDNDTTINAHATLLIHTGIAVEIPEGFVGLIFARSGLATKQGLAPANKVGVIDSDYRGEIMVPLHNHTDEPKVIRNGERVAQLVIVPYITAQFDLCDDFSATDRGDKGFGSTGK